MQTDAVFSLENQFSKISSMVVVTSYLIFKIWLFCQKIITINLLFFYQSGSNSYTMFKLHLSTYVQVLYLFPLRKLLSWKLRVQGSIRNNKKYILIHSSTYTGFIFNIFSHENHYLGNCVFPFK